MALDSEAKRISVVGLGGFRPPFKPDGSNAETFEQRIHTEGLAISLGAPGAVQGADGGGHVYWVFVDD
jgi:hypothetical protein